MNTLHFSADADSDPPSWSVFTAKGDGLGTVLVKDGKSIFKPLREVEIDVTQQREILDFMIERQGGAVFYD